MTEKPARRESSKCPSAEELFGRGRNLSTELLKLGLTVATAVVAGLAASLTKDTIPPFTPDEKTALMTAAALMVSCIGIGLCGWGATAAFYTNWAFSVRHHENGKGEWWNRRERYRHLRWWLLSTSAGLFFLGVTAAAIFLSLRLYQTHKTADTHRTLELIRSSPTESTTPNPKNFALYERKLLVRS